MKDRLRIAVVAACPFPAARGTPIRIQRLSEGLARRGHEVHVVTYGLGGPDPASLVVHRIRRVPGCAKTSPGPSLGKLLVLDPLLVGLLRRVLRETRTDLVHAHHYEGLLAALIASRGDKAPLIYDAHTSLASELPYYGPRFLAGFGRAFGRWVDARLPRRADHVIAVAPRVREALLRDGGVPPERISLVSNGVEVELFAAARRQSGERPRSGRIVFTGNFAAYQRIDLLLDAFARVAKARADAKLVLVGESSFDPFEATARRLAVRDRIELVRAPFDRIPLLLAEADIAVNPRTECDGIPQKVLNYMAAAKPVVSFAGSAVSIDDGVDGIVVPNGDTKAFADALLRLLDDPALAVRLGREGAVRAEAHSWDARAAETEKVYEAVLARREGK
jgi:glycosyltransferase involved in cell wall biosynthesis